jgi:hypothetical protein
MLAERRILQSLIVTLLVGVFWWAFTVYDAARRTADYSAQRALMTEAAMLVEAYHRQHGRYPESLASFAFTYPDGGDSSILATVRYHSNGETYEITATSAWDGSEIREPPPP